MSNHLATLIDDTEDRCQLVALLKEQRAESDCIRQLATSLRITPQSLTHHRGNKKQITLVRSPHSRITADAS
jgi:hypothetical protein